MGSTVDGRAGLAEELRRRRTALGWTLEQVAAQAQVSQCRSGAPEHQGVAGTEAESRQDKAIISVRGRSFRLHGLFVAAGERGKSDGEPHLTLK